MTSYVKMTGFEEYDVDPSSFLFETLINTDHLIEPPRDTIYATMADPVVTVKRKRDQKKNSSPLTSTTPHEEKPFTTRQKTKKKIFRMFYKGVKVGGNLRHLIVAGTDCLSHEVI
jgi:hypothetical protein